MDRRMEGAEGSEVGSEGSGGAQRGLTRREIHFLCDKCGLAGYTCLKWEGDKGS